MYTISYTCHPLPHNNPHKNAHGNADGSAHESPTQITQPTIYQQFKRFRVGYFADPKTAKILYLNELGDLHTSD